MDATFPVCTANVYSVAMATLLFTATFELGRQVLSSAQVGHGFRLDRVETIRQVTGDSSSSADFKGEM